jgi:tetratricopeptide (TPR) repeat protein
MKTLCHCLLLWLLSTGFLMAQGGGNLFPTAPGGNAPGSSTTIVQAPHKSPNTEPSVPLGEEVPVFDPGTEVVSWGGKHWNISNNRIFQARFEKYLNAPEQTDTDNAEYQKIIRDILELLSPQNCTQQNFNKAFLQLFRAATHDADGGVCNSIASAVAAAWQGQRNQVQIANSIEDLKKEMNIEQQKAIMYANATTDAGGASKKGSTVGPSEKHALIQAYHAKNVANYQAQIVAITARREVSLLQARVQFQSLMLLLFLQRRFQHCAISCHMYRQIFNEGDSAIKVEGQTKEFFTKDLGMPPTVSTLLSLATEAMRDIREGVQAYLFLVDKSEMDSATKRLSEAFLTGEYMPEIRTLPREKKRLALTYSQKLNRLVSALSVKDYSQAEDLIKELQVLAKDFDSTKPLAAVETAKVAATMHLAKARNAAIAGNNQVVEDELKLATAIWPRNPALQQMSGAIFSQSDLQQVAISDFDKLLSQGNLRQIYNDKLRFIAAMATFPERQEKLKKVLDDMQLIETSVARAQEFARRGDVFGAWEAVDRAATQFPDDVKLNQLRGNYSSEAASFVQSLKTAQQLEQQGQTGSGLAWFLKAQRQYPLSDYAKEGIDRLSKKILPQS